MIFFNRMKIWLNISSLIKKQSITRDIKSGSVRRRHWIYETESARPLSRATLWHSQFGLWACFRLHWPWTGAVNLVIPLLTRIDGLHDLYWRAHACDSSVIIFPGFQNSGVVSSMSPTWVKRLRSCNVVLVTVDTWGIHMDRGNSQSTFVRGETLRLSEVQTPDS